MRSVAIYDFVSNIIPGWQLVVSTDFTAKVDVMLIALYWLHVHVAKRSLSQIRINAEAAHIW